MSRGASLNWMSQYPFEQEILLPPLTGLELLSTRVDGGVCSIVLRRLDPSHPDYTHTTSPSTPPSIRCLS
jgi:hypothetical protein